MEGMDLWSRRLCCALVAGLASGGASAQTQVVRPDAAGRVVRVFDFDERDDNPGEVPRTWFRHQDEPTGERRPGFPPWNRSHLEFDGEGGQPFRGNGCVVLPTKGGSTSLVLGAGAIPVFQAADYRVWAKVRTQGLVHARAAVLVRFLDSVGKPVPGSDRRSELVRSEGSWTDVHVDMVGVTDRAAWIQIELLLIQPEQFGGAQPDPHRVWAQDFGGAAWFDDVAAVQLPRVEVTTSVPSNIILQPSKPVLRALVRDLAGETLRVSLNVRDTSGRTVDRWEREVGSGISGENWTPRLPALGWYRAELEVLSPSGPVGSAYVDFVWLPATMTERRSLSERRRFGLTLDTMPEGLRPHLPDIVKALGTGAVTLPAWSSDLTEGASAARAKALGETVSLLLTDWQEVTISLPVTPDVLAQSLHSEAADVARVLRSDPSGWRPLAMPFLDELGQRVDRWQIGATGDERAFWTPDPMGEARAAGAALAALMPEPVIVLPSRIDRAGVQPPEGGNVAVATLVPFDADPTSLGEAGASLAPQRDGRTVFDVSPWGRYAADGEAASLARRVIEFWSGLGDAPSDVGVSLHEAWHWSEQDRRPQVMPRPELAVWRTLTDRLRGRRVVGDFPVGAGVVCRILAPMPGSNAPGALVAWSTTALPEDAVLSGFLGGGAIRRADIFGNEREVLTIEGSGGRREVREPLNESPVFFEGVDIPLVRFLASLTFEPAHLESSIEEQERFITVQNTWDVGLSGRLKILEPGGYESGRRDRTWRVSPRLLTFSIPPGKSERLGVSVGCSALEEAGAKDFVFALELSASETYPEVQVRRKVELGLDRMRLDLSTLSQGDDVFVDALVSNTGNQPLTVNLTAFAPGLPRLKAGIMDLPPGKQAVKRFTFPGKGAALRGQKVVVHANEPETRAGLSRGAVIR